MKRYGKQRTSSRVVWDEANLNFLEETKTPKTKITEPKTPYHAPDGTASPSTDGNMMSNAEHAQAVFDALTEMASSSNLESSRTHIGWGSEEDVSMGEPSNVGTDIAESSPNGRRLSFDEQRKAHYNEFLMVKSLENEDTDSDEDADGAKKGHSDMQIDHEPIPGNSVQKMTKK